MKTTVAPLARRLPEPAQRFLHRLRTSRRVRRAIHRVRWGNLRRLEPVSQDFGWERGTPVDRYYIDRFFERHGELIHGRVLEIGEPQYTAQFGRNVTTVDILDIDPLNDRATIVADLADVGSLPPGAFDCAVVPQTLLLVSDLVAAVANLWQSLASPGTLLITTPAISRIDPGNTDVDRWHLTAPGLEEVLRRGCPGGEYSVEAYGNPIVAVAFLHGIVLEELRPRELEALHPLFPIVVTAVVRKPPLP